MADEIPQWAQDKAQRLTADEIDETSGLGAGLHHAMTAFARYIAGHEEPPVDPLLIEAREICASRDGVDAVQARSYRDGRHDAGGAVDTALAALRRGIELAGRKAGEGRAVS